MIRIEEVLFYHSRLIEAFGGADGVRDEGLLDSAINRPFQTFGGEFLYKSTEERAAAILESIVRNHPFIDGNKRTGYTLMQLLLLEARIQITATQQEKYAFVISVANGSIEFEQIVAWIRDNSRGL